MQRREWAGSGGGGDGSRRGREREGAPDELSAGLYQVRPQRCVWTAPRYDTFGNNRTTFRERERKTPIVYTNGRGVRRTTRCVPRSATTAVTRCSYGNSNQVQRSQQLITQHRARRSQQ
jgi:hypothetical protein